MDVDTLRPDTLERMARAVESVTERLIRATMALETVGIPYAVVGGHAVAGWVAQVDEGAVRNTRDVDILIRRADFAAARAALESAGFVYARVMDVDTFLDGPTGKPSQGVHLLYAGEKVRVDHTVPCPDVSDTVRFKSYRIVPLESLVAMKLVSNRDKDRTHIRDLIGVGLIDASWPARFPADLAKRLQSILATPDG
jgi:hypothetical protein